MKYLGYILTFVCGILAMGSCKDGTDDPMPLEPITVEQNADTIFMIVNNEDYTFSHSEAIYQPVDTGWSITEIYTDSTQLELAPGQLCDRRSFEFHFEEYCFRTRWGRVEIKAPLFDDDSVTDEEWQAFFESGVEPHKKISIAISYPQYNHCDTMTIIHKCDFKAASGYFPTLFSYDNAVFTVNGGVRLIEGSDSYFGVAWVFNGKDRLGGFNPGIGNHRYGSQSYDWLTVEINGSNLILKATPNTTRATRSYTLVIDNGSGRMNFPVYQAGK